MFLGNAFTSINTGRKNRGGTSSSRLRPATLTATSTNTVIGNGGGDGDASSRRKYGDTTKRPANDALSKAIDQGLRRRQQQQRQLERTDKRMTTTTKQHRDANDGISSSGDLTITPTFRDYRTYCRIINLSFGASEPEVTFPSVADAENDWRIYKSIIVQQHGNLAEGKDSFFSESFTKALKSAFVATLGSSYRFRDVNVPWNKLKSQIMGHAHGLGIYRKWSDWYQRSADLGLFCEKGAPIVISLALFPPTTTTSSSSCIAPQSPSVSAPAFVRFAKETDLRPVSVHCLGHILFQSERSSRLIAPRIDSLRTVDLKRLCAKSIYYRRIYLVHLLIYMIVYESLRCSDKQVILIAERGLRPLLQLPTFWSVAVHSEPNVDLCYM